MAASPRATRTRLLTFALSLPESSEHHPWGERVVKVRGKVFAFFGVDETPMVGVKLTDSWGYAKTRPYVEEMGYGLGRSGWVVVRLADARTAPISLLREWIEESYRAVAPKRLTATLASSDRGRTTH